MKVEYVLGLITTTVMLMSSSQSDHPVLDSRFLLYEAQQAHYFGLPDNLALASVTSNSAEVMGMGHRIGYVRQGSSGSNHLFIDN